MRIEIDEAERQMVLMGLAHLSVERPGWDDALNRIALKMDNVADGRAELYDRFRLLRSEEPSCDSSISSR